MMLKRKNKSSKSKLAEKKIKDATNTIAKERIKSV